uniref:Seminal fluid protein HACP030 n=2 Tax=Heliconius erato TaxID=33431 RepID=D9HQ44_HELEA|nr:seminal fluid protein HACP030 [Heliconius erato]
MNFTFLCLVIYQCILLDVYARYNKDVVCVINENNLPICKTIARASRRNVNHNLPIYEPYLPNIKNAKFYNCTSLECTQVKIYSITQITSPPMPLRYCYQETLEDYTCEPLKYYNYKNIDKLLFLSNNLPNKIFYLIDCLAYSDGGRVCHKKDEVDSHTKLVDVGNMARPNETNVLSQDEFICEQSQNKIINCDLDRFVPYPDGLKLKDLIDIDSKILLKTDGHLVTLQYTCADSWCGYSGEIVRTRRAERYEPPGGKVYRCYYAKRQQICKELYGNIRSLYNERDWLST